MELKIKGSQIPEWGDVTNAGLDLHSSINCVIYAGQRGLVPLGIVTQFSSQYVAIIKDRSGNALQGRYIHAGVIDSSYRGEWKVIFSNEGEDWRIQKGDRVAQVIFLPCYHLIIKTVDFLQESVRGDSGFGASGK